MEKRAFNRSLETVTLPPWARKLHVYAEWDLSRAGVERRDEQAPQVDIVWRPEQMGHTHTRTRTHTSIKCEPRGEPQQSLKLHCNCFCRVCVCTCAQISNDSNHCIHASPTRFMAFFRCSHALARARSCTLLLLFAAFVPQRISYVTSIIQTVFPKCDRISIDRYRHISRSANRMRECSN